MGLEWMKGSRVGWLVLLAVGGACDQDQHDGDRDLGERPRVVFGGEDRVEARDMASSAVRGTHNAVALMTIWDAVSCSDDTREDCTLTTVPVEGGLGAPMCHWEPFHGQEAAGFCTAFLVGEDLVMTAGHCVDNFPCEDMAFVFDYQMALDGTPRTEHLDAYGCEEIVYVQDDDEADIAVVRVDRNPPARPLCIERSDVPDEGTALASVSHPLGLPKKSADAGVTGQVDGEYIDTTLDTGPASSGSPVLDRATMTVLGVHVTGPESAWAYDAFNLCMYSVECDEEDGCAGDYAGATSTRAAADFVPQVECYAGDTAHQNPGNKFDVDDDGNVNGADRAAIGDALDAQGPGPGIFNLDHRPKPPYLDVNGDDSLSHDDYVYMGAKLGIPNVEPGSCGDFNGDGVAIDSADFVTVFQWYEVQQTGEIDGDCNGDSRLGSTDWVIAFQSGLPYIG